MVLAVEPPTPPESARLVLASIGDVFAGAKKIQDALKTTKLRPINHRKIMREIRTRNESRDTSKK